MCTGGPAAAQELPAQPSSCQHGAADPCPPAYAAEVVGRAVKVCLSTSPTATGSRTHWERGTLSRYDAASGYHLVSYASPNRAASWLRLDAHRFTWLDIPPESAASNPSHATSPKGQDAVGRRIRVFWPGNARWFTGVVRGYDPSRDMHTVDYRDGDSYLHILRHEAVQWPEPGAANSPMKPGKAALPPPLLPAVSPDAAAPAARPPAAPCQAPVHIQPARVCRTRLVLCSPAKLPSLSGSATAAGGGQGPAGPRLSSDGGGHPVQPHTPHPGPQPVASPSPVDRHRTGSLQALTGVGEAVTAAALPSRLPAPVSTAGCAQPGQSAPTYCPSADMLVLGVRIALDTPTGQLAGTMVDVQPGPTGGQHRVRWDDGSSTWVHLPACAWQCLSPRTASGGLSPTLLAALSKLGAANLPTCACEAGTLPGPTEGPPLATLAPTPASATAAVGQWLWVWCGALGAWRRAQVLALSESGSGRHLLLFEADGCEEWVWVNEEVVAWEPAPPLPSTTPGADQAANSGTRDARTVTPMMCLPSGLRAAPAGEAAVGWRVVVYCPRDQTLYAGQVAGWTASSGRHQVAYDHGPVQDVCLGDAVVVWRCRGAVIDPAPSAHAAAKRRVPGGVGGGEVQGSDKRLRVEAEEVAAGAEACAAPAAPACAAGDAAGVAECDVGLPADVMEVEAATCLLTCTAGGPVETAGGGGGVPDSCPPLDACKPSLVHSIRQPQPVV